MYDYEAIGLTLPEAYHEALRLLYEHGETVPCPDWNTEQKEICLTMVVGEATYEPRISKLFIGGPRELEQYRMEMLDGILDFEIARGNWKYTYHDRMVNWKDIISSIDQVKLVIDELKRNPYSRRAVIDIRNNWLDAYADDPACLQHIQYFIRDGALHCMVLFRSNDACKAAFMNAFALICLQERIAGELGVKVGTYIHRANSFHCYARDYALLAGYVERIRKVPAYEQYCSEDLTYRYDGDWKEIMDEERPRILADVERLRKEQT